MCLIVFAYRATPHHHLILAANRDEFYERPTLPADYWQDAPHILGGRDLIGGGTWLGLTRCGRFAAITNYRDPAFQNPDAPSRGKLISDFLGDRVSARKYLERLRKEAGRYNGFNLLVGDPDGLFYFSNRQGQIVEIEPGLHGLSNHLLDTPWPKVEKSKHALGELIARTAGWSSESVLAMLADRGRPPDAALPDTGVGTEWERMLAPMFITSATYGTRCSTVMSIELNGQVEFVERSFSPAGTDVSCDGTRRFRFRLPEENGRHPETLRC